MLDVMDKASDQDTPRESPCTPDSSAQSEEFLQTGRTGRRNALPDIMNSHAIVTTSSDLPGKLETLTTNDPVVGTKGINPGAGSSKT